MTLPIRHATIEIAKGAKVGISTTVRKYWREYFKGVSGMLGSNDQVNYLISLDYGNAKPLHRFVLKSGEPAEIRQSSKFYYIAVIRENRRHDVIVIQASYKTPPEEVKNYRLTDKWLDYVFSGQYAKDLAEKIKRRGK